MIKYIKNQKQKLKLFINRVSKKTIEIHVVEHCNLNCKSCAHFSPIASPSYIELVELEKMYKNIQPIYNKFFKSIRLMGG